MWGLRHDQLQGVSMAKPHPTAQYLLIQAGLAVALPLFGLAVALTFNVAGLETLLQYSTDRVLMTLILAAGAVTTFTPFIFTTAVLLLAE